MELAGPLALRDAKSQLQERLQALGQSAPQYELLETSGPSHEPHFRVRVSGGGVALGEGDGRSKRVAEQAAAALALERLPAPGSEPPRSSRAGARPK
jgi:ribonuclease-3